MPLFTHTAPLMVGPSSLNIFGEKQAESICTPSSPSLDLPSSSHQENMHRHWGPRPLEEVLSGISSLPFSFFSLPGLSEKPSCASSPSRVTRWSRCAQASPRSGPDTSKTLASCRTFSSALGLPSQLGSSTTAASYFRKVQQKPRASWVPLCASHCAKACGMNSFYIF